MQLDLIKSATFFQQLLCSYFQHLRLQIVCVKYRGLLKACRVVKEKIYEVDAILAIEGSLPKELIPIRDKLGIKVIENVQVK